MEDANALGVISTGEDDPFLQPFRGMPMEVEKSEAEKEQQGYGWVGRSLEDGAELEEIEIDGEKFSKNTLLRKLRVGVKLCGLPRGRNKEDAWRRLVVRHQHYAENLGVELARREFQRRQYLEGGDGVRAPPIPKMPTKAERQIHELTHWPYEDWCGCCKASRGKSHPHRRPNFLKEGLEEPAEEDKEEIRLYGGDVRAGAALVVTDNWTRSVMVLPTPGKGRAHVKFLAEQVIRYIGACRFSSMIIKADAEPPTRFLLEVIEKARHKLGFKTVVELSGPEDSQGNGRVDREIQTVRGLARTLVRQVSERAGIRRISCSGPIFAWAMRRADWLLSRFR
eukprot:s3110_g3.t1